MVVGCVFKKNKNGEYVVDNEETEKKLKDSFPENTEAERENIEAEERKLRELLGE